MFNTISNLSRSADKYGNIHFISFLGATLARLAYFNDNKFLINYIQIMGPVIQPKILEGINSVNASNLAALLDDQTIFGLNKTATDIFSNHEYQYNGKNFIDFIGLNMPQNINIINGEVRGQLSYPVPGQPPQPNQVKYISIGWSNYGEIYVVADKRMPNTIFLIFRGTYSAKTASIYSKPTSIVPLTVCNDSKGNPESFLYGIFKVTSEMIHTIVETMRYLATDFLGATAPNSVKIFTTGHSLGGAMCSNFAYLWMGIKKTPPYNSSPYNVLADNIICISLGAPRCMGSSVARKFCNFAMQKKILFLRITTRGDPVPALPPKTGFQHPCSDDNAMRMEISEDCNATLIMRPTPNVNYNNDLDCQNYKTRAYIPNALSHTIYIDIMYINAVDILKFVKGIGIAQEVSRGPDKSTICRLIMGEGSNYKVVFFDVNRSRLVSSNVDATEEATLSAVDNNAGLQLETAGGGMFSSSAISNVMANKPNIKIGGEVAEDRKMTRESFNSLVQQMTPLSGDLCPQTGQIVNSFTDDVMPDLSCPGAKYGGKRRKTKRHRNSKRYRNSKRHRNSKRYRNSKRHRTTKRSHRC
jgi:hypothetical protein